MDNIIPRGKLSNQIDGEGINDTSSLIVVYISLDCWDFIAGQICNPYPHKFNQTHHVVPMDMCPILALKLE